ncbi:hypothetical protein [Emcibacter sp. SYSU 3D8]|uniref:hypothetical protein n=1 Tax=Emcibacter sp. SYSU 3D8 TaxID=3133969 RepID=UPI0031FF0272
MAIFTPISLRAINAMTWPRVRRNFRIRGEVHVPARGNVRGANQTLACAVRANPEWTEEMTVLQAYRSYDFGVYCRQHDRLTYTITAVAYVPQREDDDWQYIFMIADPVGGKQAFDCFVCRKSGPSREDADRIATEEILPHIHGLIEAATDTHLPTAAKGTNYYVILPTRPKVAATR